MLFILAEKLVAHAIVGRVFLVDAAVGFALALRAVGGVVARHHARDKHGGLAAVSGAGGEQANGDHGGENQVLHKKMG